MDIALLLTGNELMSGDTVDSNSSMIAQRLSPRGFSIAHKVTVGDEMSLLVNELDQLCSRYPVVIVNGGLGPTVDDLTAEVLAALSGQPLQDHPEAVAHVNTWCASRGVHANEANLKQARLPVGSAVLPNAIGSAVGILLEHNNCLVLCTPGVPGELNLMLDDAVIPVLIQRFPEAESRFIRRLKLFGMGESSMQQLLSDQFPHWPAEVTVGFRAGAPLLELKLEVSRESHIGLRDQCEQELLSEIGEFIIGEDDETLAEAVVKVLQQQNRKLTLAESCTGGEIASAITSVPGASAVFEAGVVSYSNEIKSKLLGVDSSILQDHGAVSEPVARAMALGALEKSGADCAIAVSGIAGPDGGSEGKPVGTVWIAWGDKDNMNARRFFYPVERRFFQTMVAALALDLLRRFLLGSSDAPDYFRYDKAK